jgi:hypothetical protein
MYIYIYTYVENDARNHEPKKKVFSEKFQIILVVKNI